MQVRPVSEHHFLISGFNECTSIIIYASTLIIAPCSKQHVVLFIDISQVELSSSVFFHDYVKRYYIYLVLSCFTIPFC